MRRPGIEPGASRWQRDILPLNQRRLLNTYPHQNQQQTPRTHTRAAHHNKQTHLHQKDTSHHLARPNQTISHTRTKRANYHNAPLSSTQLLLLTLLTQSPRQAKPPCLALPCVAFSVVSCRVESCLCCLVLIRTYISSRDLPRFPVPFRCVQTAPAPSVRCKVRPATLSHLIISSHYPIFT